MEIKEGYIPFLNYKTYYRIANPSGKKTPLLLCHGGPGSTHNVFELLDDVAELDDRPVICYDQIGCGNSSIEAGHPELWVKETWVKELQTVREYLHLDKVHLLGHSWGGMLLIIYLCDYQPEGVLSATLSSTLSSASLWEQETHRLIRLMDEEDQKIIREAEQTGDYRKEEFLCVCNRYYERYVFPKWKKGIDPDCLTRTKKSGKEAYETAWGPSEFKPLGTLRDYEYTDKLKNITCPVFLCDGADDESTPYQNKIMMEALTGKKKWVIYPHSRHASYYEEHEDYIRNLMDFINEND